MKKQTNMMGAVLGVAAVSAVGATGAYLISRDPRGAKRMAKKVAKGAERAVLDLDKRISKYY